VSLDVIALLVAAFALGVTVGQLSLRVAADPARVDATIRRRRRRALGLPYRRWYGATR
jgi:hypothetical protein